MKPKNDNFITEEIAGGRIFAKVKRLVRINRFYKMKKNNSKAGLLLLKKIGEDKEKIMSKLTRVISLLKILTLIGKIIAF